MSRTTTGWDRLAEAGLVAPESSAYGRRRSDMWTAATGVLVLAACSIVVRDGTVGGAEESVFHAVNDLPDFLEIPMWVFQLLGVLITPLVLAAAAYWLGMRRVALGLAVAVPLKLYLEWGVVKMLVERERPGSTLTDVVIRGVSEGGLSFPSGHAVFAFAIAGLVGPYLTRSGRIVLYAVAALNGFARVYLGAHNPLDVVAGAALGLALASALNLLVRVPLPED
jgi:undecaprenyl-diphosphatase